jgi:exonuclease III
VAKEKKGKKKAVKEMRDEAECLRREEHLRLKAGTINISGGRKDKIAELEEYAARGKFDVVAVQEHRLKMGGKLACKGFKAYLQDRKFQSGTVHGGAGLLVANHLAAFTSKEPCTVKNQIWIRISGSKGNSDLLVCCAYMLQESESKEDREEAFEALHKAAKRYASKGCDVLILGDLNAKLGDPRDATETRLIGRHGEPGVRSGNGLLVVKIMTDVKLVNLGGQLPPKQDQTPVGAEYWFTRRDTTGNLHSIDYMLASEGAACCKQEFKVDYGKFDTDHHFAGAFVRSPRKSVRRRGRKKAKRRFKLEAMIPKSSKREQAHAAAVASEEYQQ